MMLFEQLGLNKRGSNELVDRFFNEIASALEAGDVVKLSGFGIFTLRQRPPGPGRNPKTGQLVPISARRVVTFHPSLRLRALVRSASRVEQMAGSARSEYHHFGTVVITLIQMSWRPSRGGYHCRVFGLCRLR